MTAAQDRAAEGRAAEGRAAEGRDRDAGASPGRSAWRDAAFWAAAGLVFALAHSQAPLFTFNQNTKLLHGMAAAGWGDLRGDWLATTPDPFPAFGAVVWAVTATVGPGAFHLLYGVVLGVYLFGTWTVASWLIAAGGSAGKSAGGSAGGSAGSSGVTSAHRAVFVAGMTLSHAVAARWAWGDLAGSELAGFPPALASQVLLGPVFEPAVFGAAIPLAVGAFLRRRPLAAGALLGAAALMHPTYLLGTAALLATFAGWWLVAGRAEGVRAWRPWRPWRPWRAALVSAAGYVAVAGPEAAYFAVRFGGAPADVARRADDLLIHVRIPHHSLPELFLVRPEVPLVAAIVVGGTWAARGALRFVIVVPAVVAAGLTGLAVALGPGPLNLVAPWRMSTFLSCLGVAAVVGRLAGVVAPRLDRLGRPGRRAWVARTAWVGLAVAVGASALAGARATARDYRGRSKRNDAPLIDAVAASRRPGEQYLVPPDMADFRLRSGARAYVTRRSHPIAGRPVLAWHDRLTTAGAVYGDDPAAAESAAWRLSADGVTHAAVPADDALALAALRSAWPDAREVWRDRTYVLLARDSGD